MLNRINDVLNRINYVLYRINGIPCIFLVKIFGLWIFGGLIELIIEQNIDYVYKYYSYILMEYKHKSHPKLS